MAKENFRDFKRKNFFLIIIAVYFVFFGGVHFARLAFDWDIVIDNSFLPQWASAMYFLFAAFMAYWVYRIKKSFKKNIEIKTDEEGEN
jgi:Ca2+/Na+ antiporter